MTVFHDVAWVEGAVITGGAKLAMKAVTLKTDERKKAGQRGWPASCSADLRNSVKRSLQWIKRTSG